MHRNPKKFRSASWFEGCRPRVGLSPYQERALKDRLRKKSPSEPWVEAQFTTTLDTDPIGRPILYRYHDPHVFPPGGENTLMIRCPECGILMPPNAFEKGKCLDHAPHRGWGPSPSAVAIRTMERLNGNMEDCPLEPEDTTSLRAEIDKFLSKKQYNAKNECNP